MPEQTLANRLERLIDAQEDIDIAVIEKGGTVTKGLENSDDDITSIPTAELGTKTIDINDTYQASSDNLDGYSSVTVNVANSYSPADNGKVVSNQTLVAQTSATYTKNGTYNTTTKNSVTVAVTPPVSVALGVGRAITCMRLFGNTWTAKTWNGVSSFIGERNIWTDGDNIYYSYESNQYVLNKDASTWTAKTWNGLSSFNGGSVWTDGDSIYYSNGATHRVLTKSPYIARSIPSARPTKAITAT